MLTRSVCKLGCGRIIEPERLALELDYCEQCAKKNPKDFIHTQLRKREKRRIKK